MPYVTKKLLISCPWCRKPKFLKKSPCSAHLLYLRWEFFKNVSQAILRLRHYPLKGIMNYGGSIRRPFILWAISTKGKIYRRHNAHGHFLQKGILFTGHFILWHFWLRTYLTKDIFSRQNGQRPYWKRLFHLPPRQDVVPSLYKLYQKIKSMMCCINFS